MAPGTAFADEGGLKLPATVFLASQAFDLHSTHMALSSGNGREGNPLMNVSTGGQIAIKAATATAMLFLARSLSREHPKLVKGLLFAGSAVTFTVAAHNYGMARR